MTGKVPFIGSGAGMLMNKEKMNYPKATRMASDLPAGIDLVFSKAFDPDPDKRYATPRELLYAFQSLSSSQDPAREPKT